MPDIPNWVPFHTVFRITILMELQILLQWTLTEVCCEGHGGDHGRLCLLNLYQLTSTQVTIIWCRDAAGAISQGPVINLHFYCCQHFEQSLNEAVVNQGLPVCNFFATSCWVGKTRQDRERIETIVSRILFTLDCCPIFRFSLSTVSNWSGPFLNIILLLASSKQ